MRTESLTGRDLRNAILFAALVYLAIKFISLITGVLLLFSIALIAVTLLNAPVSWLAKHKVPRTASASVLALAMLGLIGMVLYLVLPPASAQFRELAKQAPEFVHTAQRWLERFARDYPSLRRHLSSALPTEPGGYKTLIGPLLGGASKFTASAVGTIVAAFLIFITTIYALAQPEPLARGFLNVFDPAYRSRARAAGTRLGAQIRAWGRGVLIGMFFIFVLTWIGLSIIGIKQAFLFALIAGLMEAVPILGPILSAIPPTIVALVQNPILAVWVIVLFVIIQQLEGQLLIPIIMSHQLALHPVTVVFWVMVMGGLFGIVGVFLAMPAAATAGIVYDELYLKRPTQGAAEESGGNR